MRLLRMKKFRCIFLAAALLAVPVSLLAPSYALANQKVFRKVTPEDNKRAIQYLEQTNSLRAAGSYEEAIQLYTKAIHSN